MEVSLLDILNAINKLFSSLKSIEKITNTIGSSSQNDNVNIDKLVIGVSEVNSKLTDVNIHLGNIEALGKLILQFMIIVFVFKFLYFIVDKVFFNGC